jgi:hypothetical protein
MKIEIRANGRLEFRLHSPANPIEAAAMEAIQLALSKGQPVKVEMVMCASGSDAISVSVEV